MATLFNNSNFLIIDGGMGTMLQAAGMKPGERPEAYLLRHPEIVTEIHRQYVAAGAEVLCANTFGANPKKLEGSGLNLDEVISAAISCARKAADGKAKVALDIGPLGEMMEPNGTLRFEEAYSLFAQVVKAGVNAGADLIIIETMTDLYEIKAAVLAAKEHSNLPVLASMTFEEDGRSFAGVPVEAFAATIGGLSPTGLGINCSLGPAEIMPLLERLCNATHLPVFAMPNAGLPEPGTGEYKLSPEDFCAQMAPCQAIGVSAVGGCCGTTPATIALLATHFKAKKPLLRLPEISSKVCGATTVVELSQPVPVGERINPTGKKRLREALQAGDLAYLQTLAVDQEQAGALILDVNVGAPGVDEITLLPAVVKAVQAVTGLPLQLDSSNPEALAAALRVCCGKPVVNSTSGERDKLEKLLPLCYRYGAIVVGLTLDEEGIPPMAEQRLKIAQRILDAALATGISKSDLIIDCLVLPVGAQPQAAAETLKAIKLVKSRLGLKTMLGVSNVSFGMPNRPLINRTFLAMALQAGLDLAILNPGDHVMMGTMAAYSLLDGHASGAEGFLQRFAAQPEAIANVKTELPLDAAIERGLKEEAAKAAAQLIAQRPDEALAIVEEYLIPALDRVGQGFEAKTIFLPQLMASATAAQAAFGVMRNAMGGSSALSGPPIVVATVQGDVHDIGKNIAKVLLENYGFTVIDLGRDVPPEKVVEAAKQSGAKLVGLSALMTTTLPSMEATIKALRNEKVDCRILVGGAVLTKEYANTIGADFFAVDAKSSADYARKIHGML